ncbi:MAG: ABC transporter permease [Firmicutes bacterium]|jgi:ABC-2 type transport system permease protein|nr:ABC transporter permease [Bacillota bacterium]
MKDMRNYYLKPPNISWGIIFPFAWTLMFFLRSRTAFDVQSILPGVVSMSILFGTTSMLAVTITFERKSRSFERLLLAPLDLNLLMLAKTTGAIIFGVLNAFVPIFFALFITDLSDVNWFPALGSILLMAVTSTFLGLFIAVSVSEVFEAQTFSNFFRFPMIFLCGLFIPLGELPLFIRPLSFILPLTYGVDILKNSINGSGVIQPWLSFLVLLGFGLFLFAFSTKNIKRKWIY